MKSAYQLLAAIATVAVLAAPAQAQMKQSHAHMKHVLSSWNDTPDKAGLLPMAIEELEIAQQHAALALTKPDDLGSIKLHAGHVINALDPSVEAKGPSRGYGVVKAATGAGKHAGFAAAAGDASDGVKTHAAHVSVSAENVVAWATAAIALAKEIQASTSAADAKTKAEQLQATLETMMNGTDANGDGKITWEKGEGGLEQAAQHMGFMADGEEGFSS